MKEKLNECLTGETLTCFERYVAAKGEADSILASQCFITGFRQGKKMVEGQ